MTSGVEVRPVRNRIGLDLIKTDHARAQMAVYVFCCATLGILEAVDRRYATWLSQRLRVLAIEVSPECRDFSLLHFQRPFFQHS